MTREAFVRLLFDKAPEDLTGLIPSENLYLKDEDMDRKSAATLIHIFLREVLKEPDEASDGPSRRVLRDIYDCRVCANHVAQVYDKGIMDAYFFEDESQKTTFAYREENGKDSSLKREEFGVFELSRNMDYDEAIDSIGRVFDKNLRRKRKLTD